jgi:ABC-type transport system involved in multi-copper enzyme maturation permease subunit
MNVVTARLSYRLQQIELRLMVVLAVVAVSAAFLASARLDALRPGPGCIAEMTTGITSAECSIASDAFSRFQGTVSGPILMLLLGVAWGGALVLGTPIVARELERGTTRLAWSLSPSRVRWFLARLLPALVALAVIAFAAGVGADRLTGASTPGMDPTNSFQSFGFRGLLVASRAVFVFAIAVAVGAVLGRSLPALIVSVVVAVLGITGGERVHQQILEGEAVVLESQQSSPGDFYIAQKFRLPDGSLVGWDQIEQYDPQPQPDANGNFPPDADTWPHEPMVSIVVPAERYRFVETREAAALAGGTVAAVAIAAFAVNRRRPE